MAFSLIDKNVGRDWHQCFLARHLELRASFSRCLENKRNKAAHSAIILDYFIRYQEIMEKYKILKMRIFNVDEKGFIAGYARQSKIIIPKAKKNQKFTVHDSNRDMITMIECIIINGKILSSIIIFADKSHLLDWHRSSKIYIKWQ